MWTDKEIFLEEGSLSHTCMDRQIISRQGEKTEFPQVREEGMRQERNAHRKHEEE